MARWQRFFVVCVFFFPSIVSPPEIPEALLTGRFALAASHLYTPVRLSEGRRFHILKLLLNPCDFFRRSSSCRYLMPQRHTFLLLSNQTLDLYSFHVTLGHMGRLLIYSKKHHVVTLLQTSTHRSRFTVLHLKTLGRTVSHARILVKLSVSHW